MIYINEWLPNPVGKDTTGEFVEIFNSGKEPVNLSGWYLKTTGKTKFVLSGEIKSGGFLVLKAPGFKLPLKNTDGQLFLFDASGKQVDHQQFLGSAPEGKSYSRVATRQNFPEENLGGQAHQNFSTENLGGQGFLFSEPTAGMTNKFLEQTALINNMYPTGVPLNRQLGVFDFVLLTLGVAVVLTGLIIFVIKTNENLSNLFFRGDEEVWR